MYICIYAHVYMHIISPEAITPPPRGVSLSPEASITGHEKGNRKRGSNHKIT